MPHAVKQNRWAGGRAVFALGLFIFLFGVPLVIGGVQLAGIALAVVGAIFIAAFVRNAYETDNLIRAIDIETGETLWQDVLPAGGQANPMSYEIDGRKYIVIMTGGHHFMETPIGDHVIAYALPVRD